MTKYQAEKISLVIPALNESQGIRRFLQALQEFRKNQCEIIVVDGGSSDNTCQIARPYCDKLLISPPGRAKQMNLGAKQASGSILLFLHADTVLPPQFFRLITQLMNKENKSWGRFNVRLSGADFLFRIIERLINMRSCLTGIATGDQAMFVKADVFEALGGFPEIALMEDIALSKKLKKNHSPICIRECVVTSSRRWEQYGIWRTIFLMWRLRLAYFMGKSPGELKKKYL